MVKQSIESRASEVFKSLTPEIHFTIESSGENCLLIISETFINKSMDERMNIILSIVKKNPDMNALDLTYDFTFYPSTPNEFKNRNDASFELEDGDSFTYNQAAKPAEV